MGRQSVANDSKYRSAHTSRRASVRAQARPEARERAERARHTHGALGRTHGAPYGAPTARSCDVAWLVGPGAAARALGRGDTRAEGHTWG